MLISLLYFSGTGNTRLISETLAGDLELLGMQVVLRPLDEVEEGDLSDSEAIGLGFPVYKFTYPVIMREIFPYLARLQSCKPQAMPFFVFSTYCRFNASSLHDLASDVEKLGLTLIASRRFKCPSNGIASLQDPASGEYQSVMYFENRIDLSIRDYARDIVERVDRHFLEGFVEEHRGSVLDGLRLRIVEQVEHARYPFLTIDSEACRMCGVCVQGCPEGNLVLERDFVRIVDQEGCLHCLRCLHSCPAHAVSFGPLVHGPSRYTPGIQKNLYRDALSVPIDQPEPGTPEIRRRWAMKNIRYWLRQRNT